KLPANRYASASEMLEALRRYVQDPDVVFAYKYITEEAPAKVVKQTMNQKKDTPARPPKKGKKKRTVLLTVLLGTTVAFAVACAYPCFMILRNAYNMFTDQKGDIVVEDFVGMTRAEAEASAQISTGQNNVEWVEEYSSTNGEGDIYKQSPTGGRNIREGP